MIHRLLVSAALFAIAAPAFAQSGAAGELPDPNDRSNTFTIAAGVASVPDYEGSDEQKWIPAAAVRGRIGGMDFWSSATWLYLDLIGRPSGGGMDLDFGPIAGARLNRSGKIKDDFVDALPELDTAIEIGAFAGVSWHGLTNPYDTLSVRVDVLHDVGGAHESTLISPTLTFGTPLSRSTYLSASAMAEWAGGGYADYYYSITPAEALVAGLPAYDADGGFKHWSLSLTGLQMVTGDLTGGIGVFAMANYKRLGGDFADSPIVDLRGDADQWMGALGLSYTW
jgi:outer membrane scaffolding protein for murein synthesis (MipA/OmpV family)